ncbi:hypothetical protein [Cohnella soli]|uniref:Uncharacterized protein n=1 Tax=Cohnella soli TaxID=425005 RepID=A0ABW0HXK0_9BACL
MRRKTIWTVAEWLLVAVLLLLLVQERMLPIGSLSAEEAFRDSEKSFHYGPSEIIRKINEPDTRNQVVFLSRYKDWFSAPSVVKRATGWGPGNGSVGGMKIDPNKPLSYSWEGNSGGSSMMRYKFFGYVPDDRISTVELLKTDSVTGKKAPLRESLLHDRMFIFLWQDKNGHREWEAIRGLDSNGQVIFEEKLN